MKPVQNNGLKEKDGFRFIKKPVSLGSICDTTNVPR